MADDLVNVVALLNLDKATANKILDVVCADSLRVRITEHATKRMIERQITRRQVIACLRNGVFVEDPARTPSGSWKMTKQVRTAGDDVTVVAVLDNRGNGNYAVVITVIDA